MSGIPLEGKARSQINLVVKKLWGFPKHIVRFSDRFIPLGWLEYVGKQTNNSKMFLNYEISASSRGTMVHPLDAVLRGGNITSSSTTFIHYLFKRWTNVYVFLSDIFKRQGR